MAQTYGQTQISFDVMSQEWFKINFSYIHVGQYREFIGRDLRFFENFISRVDSGIENLTPLNPEFLFYSRYSL